LIGILIMPTEGFWPEFFHRTCSLVSFLDQLLGNQIVGSHWIEVWFFVWNRHLRRV